MGQVGVINQVSSRGGEYEIAKTIAKRFRQNRIEGETLEALSVGKRRDRPPGYSDREIPGCPCRWDPLLPYWSIVSCQGDPSRIFVTVVGIMLKEILA